METSAMYTRYIPPKKSKPLAVNVAPIPASSPISSPSSPPTQPQRVLKAPKRKQADVEAEDAARHKTVLGKRERSLRKAEKLAQESPKDDDPSGPYEETALIPTTELYDLIPLPQPEPIPETPVPSNSSLPPWLASPIRVSQRTTAEFTEVGLDSDISSALLSIGFREAFAVQAAVLPLLLPGPSQKPGDVLVSAATGSGKTLAYVLPMVEDLSRHRISKLRGVIVTPTRDLVAQAQDVAEKCNSIFSSSPNRRRLKIGTAIGSENFKVEQSSLIDQELVYDPDGYAAQAIRLNAPWQQDSDADYEVLMNDEIVSRLPDHVLKPAWKVDILICTPGRLVEHLRSTPGFDLKSLKWLVVDEADKLLDQSFQQWLEVVDKAMPDRSSFEIQHEPLRKVILSATMTTDIGKLSDAKLYRPKLVVLEGFSSSDALSDGSQKLVLPSLLIESAIKVEDANIKPLYVIEILRRQSILAPIDEQRSRSEGESAALHGVLIFTNSNEAALRLGRLISLLEPKANIATLTSSTRHSARKAALKEFQSGQLSILVASDLVSRGLDLTDLAHVINYDMPTSVTSYVHRVGRTARAGKSGHAWTLFTDNEAGWFWNEIARSNAIERLAGSTISRVNIKASYFDEQQEAYENALAELESEANGSK